MCFLVLLLMNIITAIGSYSPASLKPTRLTTIVPPHYFLIRELCIFTFLLPKKKKANTEDKIETPALFQVFSHYMAIYNSQQHCSVFVCNFAVMQTFPKGPVELHFSSLITSLLYNTLTHVCVCTHTHTAQPASST